MLMLVFLIATAIILPVMWANRVYHDMQDLGWLDFLNKPLPWGWITSGIVILVLLVMID